MNLWRVKKLLLIFVLFFCITPQRVLAVSSTQFSDSGCHTLFIQDFNNTTAQLYAANFKDPNTIQLYKSKNVQERPRQQQLIQLSSGKFGLIYHNQSIVKYTTYDPDSPISTVWQPPTATTGLNYPTVVELSDGTLIASIEFSPDTRAERLTGKSKCFDGLTGMAHCTQDVRAAILKSEDQGLTWSVVKILDNDDITVDRRGSFWQPRLVVGPNDILYLLVVEQYFDPNPENLKRDTETLWKSTNRGVSWTRVSNVFTAPLPHYQANEGDLTVKPNGRIVVVFSSNYHPGTIAGEQGDYLLITSSSDDGITWSAPKTVGKFGPNKGPSRVPILQLVNGNRHSIYFHKFVDPNYFNTYIFSEPYSLSQWGETYFVNPPDTDNPTINPVCIRDKNSGDSPISMPQTSYLDNNPSDLVPTGDTPGDQVNQHDADQFKTDFGKTGTAGWIKADINDDGRVDIFDYNILVRRWGE